MKKMQLAILFMQARKCDRTKTPTAIVAKVMNETLYVFESRQSMLRKFITTKAIKNIANNTSVICINYSRLKTSSILSKMLFSKLGLQINQY